MFDPVPNLEHVSDLDHISGHTDDEVVFPLYWVLHLIGGACYTWSTIAVPLRRWSDDGDACALLSPAVGYRVEVVYYFHAAFYLHYVASMLSITYYSYVKPTFFADEKADTNQVVQLAPP